jgi:Tfp pilus assembly protein FimV
MSTMTIHEIRLAPARPSRPAVRPVEWAGAVAGVRRPSVRHASVRLTRRGRVAVLLLGLVLALAVGVFVGAGSVATERPGTPPPTRVVMVGSGDTLWDIAADAAVATGTDDVRDMVTRIVRLNALESGMVLAGQRLRVPTE